MQFYTNCNLPGTHQDVSKKQKGEEGGDKGGEIECGRDDCVLLTSVSCVI